MWDGMECFSSVQEQGIKSFISKMFGKIYHFSTRHNFSGCFAELFLSTNRHWNFFSRNTQKQFRKEKVLLFIAANKIKKKLFITKNWWNWVKHVCVCVNIGERRTLALFATFISYFNYSRGLGIGLTMSYKVIFSKRVFGRAKDYWLNFI